MKITPAKAALLAIILGVPNMGAACLGLGVGIGLQAVAAHGRSVQTQQMNAELAQDRAACSAGDTVACLDY